MQFKSFHGNIVSLLHFPGRQKEVNKEAIEQLKELEISKPDDISIVSIMTPDVVQTSPLHYQLTKNGIDYYNSVPEDHKMWINKHKPSYVIEALLKVTTPYTLVTDGNDVVLVGDLDLLIEPFLGYEKQIIFNATSNRFPNMPIDYIPYVDDYDCREILFGPFCYLNAGVCFGYTEALIEFYKLVKELTDMENVPSEQYYVRKAFHSTQNSVFFDYDCRMFQAFNSGVELKVPDKKEDAELNVTKPKKFPVLDPSGEILTKGD